MHKIPSSVPPTARTGTYTLHARKRVNALNTCIWEINQNVFTIIIIRWHFSYSFITCKYIFTSKTSKMFNTKKL